MAYIPRVPEEVAASVAGFFLESIVAMAAGAVVGAAVSYLVAYLRS